MVTGAAQGDAGGHGGLLGPGRDRPYFDTFDGVRAFAVTAVVLFHTGQHAFRAGFLGVDVFFVLSGFLITSLILDELRKTRDLRRRAFYERRALRILPAMVVVCVACIFLALLAGHHIAAVAAGAVFTLLGVANLWHYSGHPTYLLDQTWTVSLEEQFYLFWPLLVVVAFRSGKAVRLALLVGCLAAWAAIVLVPLHGTADHIRFTYVRASGLPLGCLLALFFSSVRRVPAAVLRVLCWAAAAFLVVAVFVPVVPTEIFDAWKISMGSVATVALLAGLVLARPRALVAALTFPVVRWLGRRSYAIYLWHFPLLSIAVTHARSVPLAVRTLAALAATLAVSELSWRWVESVFLRRKQELEPGAQKRPKRAKWTPQTPPRPNWD